MITFWFGRSLNVTVSYHCRVSITVRCVCYIVHYHHDATLFLSNSLLLSLFQCTTSSYYFAFDRHFNVNRPSESVNCEVNQDSERVFECLIADFVLVNNVSLVKCRKSKHNFRRGAVCFERKSTLIREATPCPQVDFKG